MITKPRVVLWICVALAVPITAAAHGLLRRSSPAAGAILSTAPREIRLTFTEEPEPVFTRITLASPEGRLVRLDSIRIRAKVAFATIIDSLTAGRYTVEWQTAGRDGHPVRGDYQFTIAAGAAGTIVRAPGPVGILVPPQPDSTLPRALPGESSLFAPFSAILRWLMLSGVIAAIGAITFRATVLVRVEGEMDREIAEDYLPAAARATAALGMIAAVVVALVAVARFFTQSYAMHGPSQMLDRKLVGGMLLQTSWGWSWLLHLLMAIVAIAGFASIRRQHHPGWIVAAVGSVGLALSLALSGHALMVPFPAATVVAHIVHTVAAAGWLGTLLAVVLVGLPLAFRLDRDDRWTVIADIVHTFSPAALVFAGIAVVAGAFIAWTHIGSLSGFWTTEYGRILLLKLGLLAATGLTGAYNWLRVRPALGSEPAAFRLRRSASVELAIAGLVVAVTAVLVATPTPLPK